MYTSIVVPLDGSDFGMRALPVALALAKRSDAAVHLVHVRESSLLPADGSKVREGLEHEVRVALTSMATRLSREASVEVAATFLHGRALPTIQRYLEEPGHDLVVMMTHGRGGLSRWWLGSIADGLIRHTSVPLLLLRRESAWLANASEPLFRRVLVPLDGSSVAGGILDHVLSLATPDVTVYVLLMVVAPLLPVDLPYTETPVFGAPFDEEDQRAAAMSYLGTVAEELRTGEALVEVLVITHEHAAHAILDAAHEQHVDLIALSTHGRGGLSRAMQGSVADKVVRGATVPVLVYRPSRPDPEQVAQRREAASGAT